MMFVCWQSSNIIILWQFKKCLFQTLLTISRNPGGAVVEYNMDPIGYHCSFPSSLLKYIKAYIPPERKIPGVGGWRWAMHPRPEFCVTQRKIYKHIGIFCISWCKFFALPDAKPPTPNLKFALAPTPTPVARQWNIGGVGSQRKILALAMYISFFWCRFHSRWVAKYGLNLLVLHCSNGWNVPQVSPHHNAVLLFLGHASLWHYTWNTFLNLDSISSPYIFYSKYT